MTKDARDELMQLAGRDEKNQPAPPAQNELSPAQETTERNTRDVAKKAEELPNPAPASGPTRTSRRRSSRSRRLKKPSRWSARTSPRRTRSSRKRTRKRFGS